MKTFTQIPPGTQILIGRAARRRRALEHAICSVFEGWSYEEIVPPIFDYYDVFIKGMGTGLEEQVYRFIDRDGNILALRPEFTSLVAKTVVTRLSKAARPVRLYYSGEVLRFEKPKGGRQREFAQIGIEHFGSSGKSSDIEILLIAVEAFQRLGIHDFQINLGSVDFFGGIFDSIELPEGQMTELKQALNLKDQSGLESLLKRLSLDPRRKETLRAIPRLTGGREVLREARGLIKNQRSVQALDHLEEILAVFEKLDLAQHLTIDLGEVQGFDYYTGILFRAYVPQLGFEVANGGRYDGLPATFGEDLPAVGFSFSLDRLEQIATPKLEVTDPGSEAVNGNAFDTALELRRAGKAVKLCFVIALAKGRMMEQSLDLLANANIRFSEDVAASRKLIFDATDGKHRVVLVKPVDVPTYVEYGAADAGIAGLDVVLESRADLVQPLTLDFGRCKLAVAAPRGIALSASENPTVRVATKYPHIAMEYFNARGIPVEIIYLSGSIELAPLLGLADRIVDLVESGRTLKENGLEIVEVIVESSARLMINRASYQTKRGEVLKFIEALNKAKSCVSSI